MKYTSAAAFRQALDQRLKNEAASTGLGLPRLRKRVAFELFLRRLLVVAPDRWVLKGALASTLPLGALSCSGNGRQPNSLVVGGLPVTCNLTLPVACVAKAASNAADKSGDARFEYHYSKYNGWPEIKESLMAGKISAAYMLAPLVMDLADRKIAVKIVSLGHRSGAVIMVRTDSPYQHFRQLAGKRIAIPSRAHRASRTQVPPSGRDSVNCKAVGGRGQGRFPGRGTG